MNCLPLPPTPQFTWWNSTVIRFGGRAFGRQSGLQGGGQDGMSGFLRRWEVALSLEWGHCQIAISYLEPGRGPHQNTSWDFPGGLMVKTPGSHSLGASVWSLIGGISCMPLRAKKKKKKNPTCWHPHLGHLASRTFRNTYFVVEIT